MANHLQQARIGAPEMLSQVRTVLDDVPLVLAVDDLPHALDQQPVVVARKQVIPVRAPEHLENVPAGAPEHRFELLDDLTVAPDRTIEPLQVAVDHENQVVELLARRERDRSERLWLVRFAVTEEGPHFLIRRSLETPILEILDEARVIN